jgi:hypothetical protein
MICVAMLALLKPIDAALCKPYKSRGDCLGLYENEIMGRSESVITHLSITVTVRAWHQFRSARLFHNSRAGNIAIANPVGQIIFTEPLEFWCQLGRREANMCKCGIFS